MMVAVRVASASTTQLEAGDVPDAHPCQAYVRGSPSGSDACAWTGTEQGAEGRGWQLDAFAVAVTVGGRFGGGAVVPCRTFEAEPDPPRPSLTVTDAV